MPFEKGSLNSIHWGTKGEVVETFTTVVHVARAEGRRPACRPRVVECACRKRMSREPTCRRDSGLWAVPRKANTRNAVSGWLRRRM